MPAVSLPISEVGKFGLFKEPDRSATELPLNAWNDGRNVRMRDGMVEKFLGHTQVFGVPTVVPYFAMPISIGGNYFWIYAGLNKIYNYDGSVHNNITRQSAGVDVNYAATAIKNWTGGRLGPVAILNNGVDLPQFWTGTGKCFDLTNWNVLYRAQAVRVFRRFIIAMDITKNTVRYPQMVKWSHPAATGAVPISWDEADETKDAGEYEILDSDGALVDGFPMRDAFVLYKEDSVHLMQFVGGVDIFRFVQLFDSFGILSRRCAGEYAKGKHAVFALGDLIAHDGQTWESIISSRMRKWLFSQIDSSNYSKSFVVMNPAYYEVWFCFPTTGNTTPNLAIVWNWKDGSIGVRDIDASHIAVGNVTPVASADIWDNDTGVWDNDPSLWDEGVSNPAGKRLLIADSTGTKFHWADSANQFNGVNMTSSIERKGLPLPLTADGPPDMLHNKFVTELWPRIQGTSGSTLNLYVGSQQTADGPVTWKAAQVWTIGTSKFIDFRISAPLFAFKLESLTALEWRLAGYEIRYRHTGRLYG